ncbi:MAG: DUF2946 domain-containing protein [Pseudomonadota bacterium]
MKIKRLTRYFTAWVACLAISMAALMPSISHALAAANTADAFWAEICSVNGPTLIKMAKGHAPDSSTSNGKEAIFEHCPACLTHAGSSGLPPATALTLPAARSGSSVFPSLFFHSLRPLFVWATPQSRAPPFYS